MSDEHTKTALAKPDPDAMGQAAQMHPMVAAAMQAGSVDTASLEKLMELQERWEAGEAKKAYADALVRLKRDLPQVIAHDKVVDYTSSKGRTFYTHASLAAVAEAVVPVLCNYGFAHQFLPETRNGKVALTCRILHREGHFDERTLEAAPDTSGGKNPIQGIASTTTYLSRYLLCKMLGIETKEMRQADDVHTKPSEAELAAIDPHRNMNALRKLKRMGITQAEAEAEFGPLQAWTAADRARMGDWVDARGRAQDEPEDAELVEPEEDWGKSGPPEDAR